MIFIQNTNSVNSSSIKYTISTIYESCLGSALSGRVMNPDDGFDIQPPLDQKETDLVV